MNMKYKRVFALGIGLITMGVMFVIGPEIGTNTKELIFATGAVMLGIAIIAGARTKEGEVASDERTQKLTDKALAYSWWLTYLLLAALLSINHFTTTKMDVPNVLAITFFFMVFSACILKMYFKQRGDL